MDAEKNPNKTRSEVLARFATGAIDLMEELDNLLRILKFQREALVNSMTDGFGYKKMELNPAHAKLAAQLAVTYQKAVDAKVKLDKHLRDRAEELTPAEEIAGVKTFIECMDSTARRKLLISLLEFHNINVTNPQWLIKSE